MGYKKLDLAGKAAVVIGGTSGIGQATALGLAEAGANVVATSRHWDKVQETSQRIRDLSRKTIEVTSDVTSPSSVQNVLEKTIEISGHVDILVNAAGRTKKAPTLELSVEEFRSIMDTNLTGTLIACQVFGKHMVERGYGRIINIASLSSFVGFHEVSAYTASKSAVAGLTKALAVEWGPCGVNVNAIAPGVFPTELNRSLLEGSARGEELLLRTPLRRFGRVEELAGAAVFLASEAASFVNGEVLTVDGGFLASGVNQ